MRMARLSPARKGLLALALLVGAGFLSACEDIDWDWEARWWVKPTREVRPNRVVSSNSGPAAPKTQPAAGNEKSSPQLAETKSIPAEKAPPPPPPQTLSAI